MPLVADQIVSLNERISPEPGHRRRLPPHRPGFLGGFSSVASSSQEDCNSLRGTIGSNDIGVDKHAQHQITSADARDSTACQFHEAARTSAESDHRLMQHASCGIIDGLGANADERLYRELNHGHGIIYA